MKNSDFDNLLERYLTGRTTPDEKKKIEAWLDSRKTKEERNATWTPEEEQAIFQKITASIQRPTPALVPELARAPWKMTTMLRMAAGILLFTGVGWWLLPKVLPKLSEPPANYTTTDQPKKFILSDGTIVWLRPGSSLVYHGTDREGRRQASLTGEGIFEVAKDAQHPFQIRCAELFVTVLGTSFHLKSNHNEFALDVLTGSVNVSSESDPKGIIAEPQERIVVAANHVLQKIVFETNEMTPVLAPTEYRMQFENTSLDAVFARIEKKFDAHLAVTNPAMLACRITADFTDQSLERTFQILTEVLDLNYKINGSTVTVGGAGCHP